jgi:hypothetical protein
VTPGNTRRNAGQAIAELALSLPLLVLLGFGATDMGRAWYDHVPVAAAALAGAETGATSATADLGAAVRTQNQAMPNDTATWGTAFSADCTNATIASQTCGDSTGGCAATSVFWTTPGGAAQPDPIACFSIRSCTIDTTIGSAHSGHCTPSAQCPAAGGGSRPGQGSGQQVPPCNAALQVTVVYRFVPATPLIGAFFSGTSNTLFISSTATVVEEY